MAHTTTSNAALRQRGQQLLARGDAALQHGHYEKSARLFETAVDLFERGYGPARLEVVQPLRQLAVAYANLARLVDAGPLYQRALAILEDGRQGNSLQAADIFRGFADLELAAGNWLRGEPFARRAVTIRQRLLGSAHPDVAADLAALGTLLLRQGKKVEARRLFTRVVAVLGSTRCEDADAATLNILATARRALGNLAGAEVLLRRVLEIETAQRGAAHPAVADAMTELAALLQETRRPREAAALFRRALAILSRSLGPTHPRVGACLRGHAAVLRRIGQPDAARRAARRAARILALINAVNNTGVAATGTINPMCTAYRLIARRSAIHRLGVFTEDDIPKGRKVIEYTGERIGRRESGRRWDPKQSYLFELNAHVHLDGATGGSGAEYVNHSCAPNLKTRILSEHILYYSTRPIRKGEELTVDYRYDADTDPMACYCGAPTCRGTMNLLPEKKKR